MLGDFVMSTHHPTPDACIACTTCVVNCPVARATPNYLGPRLIGPAYERFRLLGLDEEKSLHYCSNCKNCDISCPHGVPVSTFNMMARADYCRTHKPALRDWVLGHGELLAKLLRPLPAGLKNFGMLNPLTRKVLDKIGIAAEAPLPAFAPARFRDRLAGTYQGMQPRKVALFPGCFIDIYDPQTGFDLVWLLNRAGYEVIIPKEFSCCGLPMIANGFANDAKANAKRNLRAMRRMQEQGIPVISSCPSCVLMLNQDVPEFCKSVKVLKKDKVNPEDVSIEDKDWSLAPSKYIEFIDHDLDIDYKKEMARIQGEMRLLMASEELSQSMLKDAFRGIGYGIE